MPKRNIKLKKGGGLNFPAQYFNPDANIPKYYPQGSNELTLPHSSYGPSVAVSQGMPTGNSFPNMVGSNLGPVSHAFKPSNIHTGGGNPYDFIINPFTNRKVSIFSKKGKSILKYYVNSLK